MTYNLDPRKPMFSTLHYCTRCGMPSTERDASFDEMGTCVTCQSSEQKMYLDWTKREKALREILDRFRGKGKSGYDCIVPISGGKDSSYQLYLVKERYEMNPLAVTFSQNWHSEVGLKNLKRCLEVFDVDHMMFTPKRSLVNRCARRSLEMIGDACWHCHAGVGTFPLQAAVNWNIPLIIYGESSAELSASATYEDNIEYDPNYFFKVSAIYYAEEFACDYLPRRELAPFEVPDTKDIEEVGVIGIHIGNYVFWDAERQMEFLRERYGWSEDTVEGTYKCYKSNECIMPGVHDYTKFLKRGYGRAADHTSQDIRAGLMTRAEAFELVREHDPKRPEILDYYLKITGYTEAEFLEIMGRHREAVGSVSRADIEAAIADHESRFGPPVRGREDLGPK